VHEYAIASSLLRMVEERARAAGARRVLRVVVRIGAEAGVEIDLLRTAWEGVRETPVSGGAELEVNCVPVRWVCALCRAPIEAGGALRCPECDVAAVLDGGGELLLERIELEKAEG
jgi:hydrogenase nickel incorporation protein HypA/HybF